MSKKLMTGLLALVAFAALALPAVASASPELTQPTGTTVATGTKIKATNVEGNTLMTNTSGGIITDCSSAVLTGELAKNSGTAIEGTVTSAVFTGTGGGANNACTGTFFSNPRPTPGVANGLPWCVRATSTMLSDEAQIRGGKCSEASREIRFALDLESIGVTCLYGRANGEPITGTLTTDTTGDAIVRVSGALFRPVSTPFPCPEEGLLDMNFTIETDPTSGTASPMYIS
jgi:hypothetical protein